MTHEVERFGVNREVEGRDHGLWTRMISLVRMKRHALTHREDDTVEDDSRQVERLCQSSQSVLRPLEAIGSHREAQQGNETVRCDSRNTACGDEGRKCNLGGEDGAQDSSAEDEHDGNRALWLAVLGDLPDPTREGKNTITGDSEDKAGCSHDGNAGVLVNTILVLSKI